MRSETLPRESRRRPGPSLLPVAGVVVVQGMSGREGYDPQPHHEGPDGENPFAGRTIVDREAGGFTGAENLTADANGHEKNAEDESKPDHGDPLYPIRGGCGKRQCEVAGSKVLVQARSRRPEQLARLPRSFRRSQAGGPGR